MRFIELMPIGECADWPRERFLSADAVLHALPELQRLPNEGVAEPVSYTHLDVYKRQGVVFAETVAAFVKTDFHSSNSF